MITQAEPSIVRQFLLAIRNRRQPVQGRRIGPITIREITSTLAWVSCSNAGYYASGRRAIGRAVRLCHKALASN